MYIRGLGVEPTEMESISRNLLGADGRSLQKAAFWHARFPSLAFSGVCLERVAGIQVLRTGFIWETGSQTQPMNKLRRSAESPTPHSAETSVN